MGNPGTNIAGMFALLAFACATAQAEPPAGPLFQELGHNADYFQNAGSGRFAVADLDHDGAMDLVFDGVATNSILFVVGKAGNGSYDVKQALITPDTGDTYGFNYGYIRVLAWAHGPATEIVTVSSEGIARIYAGWPLAEQSQFPVDSDATAAAVGDVDADGSAELVVLTPDSLCAYDLATGDQEWSHAISGGSDIALAQLDGDPALEIIVGGPKPGLVLDGATQATDWSYIDGFGSRLTTGVFSATGDTQWLGVQDWGAFTVFRANPWSPLWDYTDNSDIGAVATGDLDADGLDEILYGDDYNGLHVISPITRQELFYIVMQGSAPNKIAVGAFAGGNLHDIAFTTGGGSSQGSTVSLADGGSGNIIWTHSSSRAPYQVTAVGDVDGDGTDEVIAAGPGQMVIRDAGTGTLEWRSPDSSSYSSPFNIDPRRIMLVSHASAPGMDIVLAGKGNCGAKLLVFDGASKTIKRQFDPCDPRLLPNRTIDGLALMDYDGDGFDDFVVATSSNDYSDRVARLEVISGFDDSILWESVGMNSTNGRVNNLLLIPPQSAGGASELVAVLPDSLRAYNSQTQLLNWVLSTSNEDAAYIAVGLNGPELMTYQADGTIRFFDAATRAPLRTLTATSPLKGVTVLQGDAHTLLLAADRHLEFVDGSDGSVLAQTDDLGEFFDLDKNPALLSVPSAAPLGSSSWYVAITGKPALWRMRLDATDRIFLGTFEAP